MADVSRPFQPLDERLAGDPLDEALFEGTPAHLSRPLQQWIAEAFLVPHGYQPTLARRVALRLRVELPARWTYADAILQFFGDRLHVVADAILQLYDPSDHDLAADNIHDLAEILDHDQSAYRVDESWRMLVRRVDKTTEDAFRSAVGNSSGEAARHLRNAWGHAYGLEPDPTAAYREAVRAVEAVACPKVLPSNDKATLGTVIAHLRQAPNKWQTILVDKDGTPGNPEPIRLLLDRLWTGQVSRHGGGKNSRDQDPPEAEAAVHIAALLVQILTSGAMRPSTP